MSRKASILRTLADAEMLVATGDTTAALRALQQARDDLVTPQQRRFAKLLHALRGLDRSQRKHAIRERMDISDRTYHRLLSECQKTWHSSAV